MITISYEQKKYTGLQYILNLLNPVSPYGKEAVKRVKPFQPNEKEKLEQELNEIEKIVLAFDACKMDLNRMEHIMSSMKDIHRSLEKGMETSLHEIELFEIRQFLIALEELMRTFQSWNKTVGLDSVCFYDISEALLLLDPEGKRVTGFYLYESYSKELKEIRESKRQIEMKLRNAKLPDEMDALTNDRRIQVVREEEEEKKIRAILTDQLKKYREQIQNNCEAVGRLDFLLQKAKAAMQYTSVKPDITKDTLSLEEAVNPEIAEHLQEEGKQFKRISIEMKAGVTVITGANMGGKSVALRTVALHILLAQYGFFVYAKKAQLPVFDYFHIIANEYESVKDGLSSFGGEIMELNKALCTLKEGYGFFLFDEPARGTNPREGAALVQSVVKYLNKQQAMTLLATHYDHIAEFADAHYQVYGLKNMNPEHAFREMEEHNPKRNLAVISKYMDYGIYRVSAEKECPKDAISICKLLGLDKNILELLEQILE